MDIVAILTLVFTVGLKVLAFFGGAAALATVTPNKATSGNMVAQFVLDAINFAGGNFGRSANRD